MNTRAACVAAKIVGRQSRLMSAAEAVVNVVVGYGMAVATQMAVFPLFGLQTTTGESFLIGAIFTVTSVVRSYTLRRLFERLRAESLRSRTAALWRAAARVGLVAGQLPMR